MTCIVHLETVKIPCKRWRTCPGCALRIEWELTKRLEAGIRQMPIEIRETKAGNLRFMPMFATLTFPADRAPTAKEAQRCWSILTRKLKYRGLLGEYGWVLQRQGNKSKTLHFHAIAHMPFFKDGLKEWRGLVIASGFGPQQRIEIADVAHARYCAQYMTKRVADLPKGNRAWSFSRGFPKPHYEDLKAQRDRELQALTKSGMYSLCDWVPDYELTC